MSLVPQSADEPFFAATAVMEPTAPGPLTRSARRRQKLAQKQAAEQPQPGDLADDQPEKIKSGWIAMGFSLAVHAFLLAILAVLVVQGATISAENDAVIDSSLIGGGGGNAGLGEPVSLDLQPLLPAAGDAPAMAKAISIADISPPRSSGSSSCGRVCSRRAFGACG